MSAGCAAWLLASPHVRAVEAQPLGTAGRLEQRLVAAETSLQAGETQLAESHYRAALGEGWLLLGMLEAGEGRLDAARDAFRTARVSVADSRQATQYLAMALLERGDAGEAVTLMTHLVTRNSRDIGIRRLLAQALVVAGRVEEAVQELEEAREVAPEDPELVYALAAAQLRLKKAAAAERLFAELARMRPLAATHVLIGRTYSDFGELERARSELRRALELDPRVRRAHYYLGMVAANEDLSAVDAAIPEFQAELELAPDDPPTNLALGLALVMARRYPEALPALEKAVLWRPPQASAFYLLGRCRLGLGRAAEAATALRRALELAERPGAEEERLRNIHYQLGLALRRAGEVDAAAEHFAAAERLSGQLTDQAREDLDRFLKEAPRELRAPGRQVLDTSAVTALNDEERLALRRQVRGVLARAYFNLGVLQAQAEGFARAAEHFEETAEIDPKFPRVQYSLGVAHFNAGHFDEAAGPLAAALEETPADINLRRMLAMAWLNTEAYGKAADLLENDPARRGEPSLQYAYGLALARSDRAAQAEPVFAQLLEEHGDTAELHVLLGQAHAQQGNFPAAIESFERALALDASVEQANAALGNIYLRQGRLPEAETALRRELSIRPDDPRTQHTLAAVLELEGEWEEALSLLRSVLRVQPDFTDARYLFGKILLAQGSVDEAVEHLEAAARTSPGDANVHYQLGRAYQRLRRPDAAKRQFELFQQLKDRSREPVS